MHDLYGYDLGSSAISKALKMRGVSLVTRLPVRVARPGELKSKPRLNLLEHNGLVEAEGGGLEEILGLLYYLGNL